MGGRRWAGAVAGWIVFAGAAPAAPSTHLPPTHWAVRAAERLDNLGLVTDYLPAQRSVPISEVERVLSEAAKSASPELRATAEGWLRQLHEELGGASSGFGVNASLWVDRSAEVRVSPATPLHPPPAVIASAPTSPGWAMGASAKASAWLAAGAVDFALSDGRVHPLGPGRRRRSSARGRSRWGGARWAMAPAPGW